MSKKLKIIITLVIGLGLAVFAFTTFFSQKKSDEILNRYKSVDSAMKAETSEILDNVSDKKYSEKNQPKVDLLKAKVETLCDQIDDFKSKLTDLSENEQSLSDFLIKDKNAARLKNDVHAFKRFLTMEFQDIINTHPENKINIDDINEDGQKMSWENYNFKNSPLAAMFSTLDKLETEIHEVEQDVLKQLK